MGRKRTTVLTPRQREWLAHLRACRGSGQSLRSYAAGHGLSEHALYQAAKELRKRGAWPRASRRAGRPTPVSFLRVQAPPPLRAEGAGSWRIRLPNGVVLEATERLGTEWLEALARL